MEQVALPGSEETTPVAAPTTVMRVYHCQQVSLKWMTCLLLREFRNLVQELLDSGVDPSEMMSDARLEDINERALAQNFETWPVFMQMVS